MFNVLKNALIYTGVYFIITTVIFWTVFFVLVALQVFAKAMLAVFCILLAVFTFDYLKKRPGPVSAAEVKRTVQNVMNRVKAKHGVA